MSHIRIPELDEFGLNYEEGFRFIHVFLKHYVYHLKEIFSSKSIDDLKAYPLSIADRIVKMSSTFNSVVERDNDYVVANIIIRSIADSISTYILIYNEPNDEERLLRHYLYISDGLNGRINQLKKSPEYDNNITINEYNRLSTQITNALKNYEGALTHSTQIIKDLNICRGNKHVIEELIKHNNWKYKKIGLIKNNKYSWSELYSKLGLNISSDFFSTQSEFVHGLSTSNFYYEINDEDFEPLYGIATVLIGKLIEILKNDYSENQKEISEKMITGLHDIEMPQNYINWLLKNFSNR